MASNFKTVVQVLKELNYILTGKQKKKFFWLLLVIIVSAGLELVGVSAILPFVEAVISPEKMMNNEYIIRLIPILHINSSEKLLILVGVALIIVYLLKNAFMLYANYVQYDFSTRVQMELSVKMLKAYMDRPYVFFVDTNTSEILRGCANDTVSVYTIIDYLSTILSQILAVFFIGVFLIYTDPVIAISVLFLMLVVLMGMVLFFKPAIKKAGQRNVELSTAKSKTLLQAVNGIKDILVMQRKKIFLDVYEEVNDKYRKIQRTYGVLSTSPDRIVEGICISGIIGIVCIRLADNSTDMASFIPKLAAFAVAAFKILPSIGKLANRMSGLIYHRPGLANVYRNMLEADKYAESVRQYSTDKNMGSMQQDDLAFEEKLVINHVYWKYENQKMPVLTDVAITMRKGESVALIGASGAGKTTLADIILGLLQPIRGSIEMDGIDVYTIPMQWAHIVGYVPQSVYLIDDTVRSNVAFGMPAEMVEDKYIWNALEKAQLKEFIVSLPNGLDTIVGERGVKFSGGQCQRIAIARALYNNPEILVLDEATAALDNETETAVMESIEALQGHITMIIVAHRLTTIRNCDRIYEIKDGVAVERSKKDVLGE